MLPTTPILFFSGVSDVPRCFQLVFILSYHPQSKEKHPLSQESTGNSTSSKTTSTPATSSSDVVEVMERETGKILKGPSAPTQKGLHRWLEQHPSFEVVQPHKHRSSSRKLKNIRLMPM